MSNQRILPTAQSEYNIDPSFSTRLRINQTSGIVTSNGQLQHSDSGEYSITSDDYTLSFTLEIEISGMFHNL